MKLLLPTGRISAFIKRMRDEAKVSGSRTDIVAGHTIDCYLTAGHQIRWRVDGKSRSALDTAAFVYELFEENK